jgi:hypothetical protein
VTFARLLLAASLCSCARTAPPAPPTFVAGPETRGESFSRRTFTRGAVHVTVTDAAGPPLSAAQFDEWVRMSASFPTAPLDASPELANGFYQCTGDRCDLLIQLRSGRHLELRGDGTATRADVDAVARLLDLGGRRASFRADVLPVLVRRCGAEGCHGEQPTHSVPLDLRTANVLTSLREHPSKERPTASLIAPGHPARSFLLDKLSGPLERNEGKVMPLDPETGGTQRPSGLEEWTWDVLAPWIARGAPED